MLDRLNAILVVDDEADIRENVASFLRRAGFSADIASDGEAALTRALSQRYDVIVMDVLMPKSDGRETLRRLRQSGDMTPVILLTRVGESSERAMALEEGADDYLNKPFDPYELVARIRALLRRARPGKAPVAASPVLASAGLRVDRAARRTWLDGKELVLTPKAFALLEYLMTHAEELLTRERLLDAVWGWDYPAGTRAVDTRVAELRRVLQENHAEPRFIQTVPGQGYRFAGLVEGAS